MQLERYALPRAIYVAEVDILPLSIRLLSMLWMAEVGGIADLYSLHIHSYAWTRGDIALTYC